MTVACYSYVILSYAILKAILEYAILKARDGNKLSERPLGEKYEDNVRSSLLWCILT